MKKIKTVGVVGAGTMGSALAQKFAQEGFNVILADRAQEYVDKGLNGIKNTLNDGVERKIFKPEQVETFLSNISGSTNLEELVSCDLIIEAIFEDKNAKQELFQNLSKIIKDETIVATNTSSFSVSELASSIVRPERFIGMHYFYHAVKNRLVEIIPGEKTSKETYDSMRNFSVQSGKDAITTKDNYGFAVNRFFVPWLNEAVRLLEENIADTFTIDKVCMKLFGIGMGPFALMNATGVPIAYHAQKTLEVFGDFYRVADLLKSQANSGKPWVIMEPDGSNDISPDVENLIRQRMLGVVFLVCSQILDEKVCTASELNRGAKIGLRWRKGPIDLMNITGVADVINLVQLIADKYKLKMPASIDEKNWRMEFVQLKRAGSTAIINIARPEDLNALNEEVMKQLSDKFSIAEEDNKVDTIILTGLGKAFVAGADIKFFVHNIKNNTISNIESFTKFGQDVYSRIDNSKKKVVAIINGLALGGGLELALCADLILALPKAIMGFPETGIGIYPALGGTQRTSRKIGKGLAKNLIFTGELLNSSKAQQIGLVDSVIDIDEYFELLGGNNKFSSVEKSSSLENTDWNYVENFFDKNKVADILNGKIDYCNLPEEQAGKFVKMIKRKAPLALEIAEKLIDKAEGCESELNDLKHIFSTEDALLGLTSIGKRVEFSGR